MYLCIWQLGICKSFLYRKSFSMFMWILELKIRGVLVFYVVCFIIDSIRGILNSLVDIVVVVCEEWYCDIDSDLRKQYLRF